MLFSFLGRATGRRFVGHSIQEEGTFAKPSLIVHLGGLGGDSVLKKLVGRLNRLEPRPRLLVVEAAASSKAVSGALAVVRIEQFIVE